MRTNREWQGRLTEVIEARRFGAADDGVAVDRERQVGLLDLLHRHAAACPWPYVHATWLAECLPEDGRLRRWCLMLLPEKVRASVAEVAEVAEGRLGCPEGSATVLFEPLPPPAWLAGWWRHQVMLELGYPLPLPESTDLARPLSFLWCLSPDDSRAVLERFGLRCLAAEIAMGSRQRAAQQVFALSPAERPRVVELVRSRAFPEGIERLPIGGGNPMGGGFPVPAARALEVLALDAGRTGSSEPIRRLAYRLPVELGRSALSRLDETVPPEEEALRCDGECSLEQWLQLDVRELLTDGRITLPIPGEVA